MLLTLSLAMVLGRAEPTIDFDHPPAPAPVIVEALAKKLGRNLVADEDLAVDILIVHLDDADPDKALEWIAEAIEGEWRQDDNKLRLTRSHETVLRQEREERFHRVSSIDQSRSQFEVAKPLDKPTAELIADFLKPIASDQYANVQIPADLMARLPLNRLVTRIYKALDFSPFVDMPLDTSVYLPFTESDSDRRLPRTVDAMLADYKKEDAIYAAALRTRGVAFPGHLIYGAYEPGKWEQGSIRAAVEVSNNFGLEASLVVSWGDGFATRVSPFTGLSTYRPERTLSHEEWDAKPFINETARKFWALRSPRALVPEDQTTKVPLEVESLLLDDTFDLFQLGTYDMVVQAAKLLNKSLVALFPDSTAYMTVRPANRREMSLQEVMDYVLLPSIVKAEELGDVVVLRPASPSAARRERLARATIQQIVRDAKRGFSDLSIYARLTASSDPFTFVGDPRVTFARATRILHMQDYGTGNHSLALRIHGSLSSNEIQAARSGGAVIPWQSLTNALRSILVKYIDSEALVGRPGAVGIEGESANDPRLRARNAMLTARQSNVPPTNLIVQIDLKDALAGGDSTSPSPSFYLIDGLSFDSMVASKEMGASTWNTDRFVIVPMTTVTVWLQYGDERYEIARYQEGYAKETQPTISFDQIPKEMIEARRAQIERAKEAFRRIPPN